MAEGHARKEGHCQVRSSESIIMRDLSHSVPQTLVLSIDDYGNHLPHLVGPLTFGNVLHKAVIKSVVEKRQLSL